MFSCYIFDCDGVLFDSLQANIEFYNYLLTAFGKPPMTQKQITYIHMATAEESVDYLFRNDPRRQEAQQLRLNTDYHRFIPYMKLAPGAREVLQSLKEQGKRLAICTNRSTSMEAILEYFSLTHFFDCVVTALHVKNPKPDPEGLLLISKTLKITPDDTLYIGDSPLDAEASRLAGIPFAAYQNPDLEAEYHINSFVEIISLQPSKKGAHHAHCNRY